MIGIPGTLFGWLKYFLYSKGVWSCCTKNRFHKVVFMHRDHASKLSRFPELYIRKHYTRWLVHVTEFMRWRHSKAPIDDVTSDLTRKPFPWFARIPPGKTFVFLQPARKCTQSYHDSASFCPAKHDVYSVFFSTEGGLNVTSSIVV